MSPPEVEVRIEELVLNGLAAEPGGGMHDAGALAEAIRRALVARLRRRGHGATARAAGAARVDAIGARVADAIARELGR
jgi:hypothetical protein